MKHRLAAALALVIAGTQAHAATPLFPAPSSSTKAASADARYALHLARRNAAASSTSTNDRASLATHARGDTHVVTSCADDGGAETLRAVISGAGEGDIIDLSALTCGTITLTQGVIDVSASSAHPVTELRIIGPGADALTIDGNGDRVFAHGDDANVEGTLAISDLTIANGGDASGIASCIDSTGNVALVHAVVTDCSTTGGSPVTFGGAISAASLYAAYSTIANSYSVATGENVAVGGGAYVSGDAMLVESTISGNRVVSDVPGDGAPYRTAGGGLYVRGTLMASRSTFDDNAVLATSFYYGWGGALFARSNANVETSTFAGNSAPLGGALYKSAIGGGDDPGSTLTVSNSTFAGNGAQYGGGIVSVEPATIANSTITDNRSFLGAGGIQMKAGADLVLQSSIVARNGAGDYVGKYCDLIAESAVTGGNNVVIVASGATVLPADTIALDPMLSPLADNGGPTPTVAPYRGSPAVDAGANPVGFAEDQRGAEFPRTVGRGTDIGAVELQENESEFLFKDSFEPPAGLQAVCFGTEAS
jgi:hypothetical protein